jgi:glycosyltransferase involved in cell wall biosynthesis
MAISIVYIGDGGVSDAVRLRLPAHHLIEEKEIEGIFVSLDQFSTVKQVLERSDDALSKADLAVFTRPANPELVEAVRERYGLAIVADVDDDFHALPKSHPGYMAVGPGNPAFLEKHITCLDMVDKITCTTAELATRLRILGAKHDFAPITVIPNGWGESEWWGWKFQRDTVNIGWGGTITHRADFVLCMDALLEIAYKYKYSKIVIAGDPEIYKMLKPVKEEQKMFLPMVRYEDYPHTLMYYDILLAPLENNYFNNAKSDIKLVDAGAAKIPYVASDVPIYQDNLWNDGGYLVSGKDSWFNALEELVLYPEIRKEKGERCRRAAEARHIALLAKDWMTVYEEALH